MNLKRKIGVLILAVGIVCFLFAVICPLTPTPAALSRGQGTQVCASSAASPQPLVVPTHLAGPSPAIQARLLLSTTALPVSHSAHSGHAHIIDLTCARLC